jgi:long-chain acyl-CoA synthetase
MKNFSVEVGPPQPNGGRIRRSVLAADGVVRVPDTNVHTLYDVLQNSVKKYGDKKAFGSRRLEKMVEEEKEVTKYVNGVETKEKKVWKYFQLSGYEYITYKEASDMAHAIGNGFAALGLQPKAKVEIFSGTK